jgi:hypothetical protein
MHGGARELEISAARALRVARDPWAVALNQTAATDDITVTLLTLAVVDEFIRVSGLMRLVRRSGLRLSSLPALTLCAGNGAPLELLRAHALPDGSMFWVSWIYRQPAEVCTGFEGRIDHIDLVDGARVAALPGPWAFTFNVSKGSSPGGRSQTDGSAVEA